MKITENIQIAFPKTLTEALRLQANEKTRGQILAGGTDLMVQWAAGVPTPERAISIWNLPEISSIQILDHVVEIGSGVTHAFLRDCEQIRPHLPALVAAASTVGAKQIQSRGTLGGNIANASPAGDTAPALLVAGGTVRLASLAGTREVPLAQFWLGYKKIDIRPDEIIVSFLLPKRGKAKEFFRKIGTRRAQAISKVMIASRLWLEKGTIRSAALALGSMAATPIRLTEVEAFLLGKKLSESVITQAEALAQSTVRPMDDIRSTADYRRWAAGRLVRDALENLYPTPK